MNLPVFALRPEPGLSTTLAAGAAMGLEMYGAPLFVVEPVDWDPVHPDEIDALIVGSANALRHGGKQLAAMARKPVYAVGARTAEAARAAGFTVAATGEGGLQRLLDTTQGPLRLLRLAGEARIALAPPEGVSIVERAVYRACPLALDHSLAARLTKGGAVLLHSAEAGRHFAAECDRLGIARAKLGLIAIGPRVLEVVGAGWAWTAAAPRPDGAALLALARDLCLTRGGSKNGR